MSAYYSEFDPGAAAWLRELIKEGHIADGEVDERSILDVRPDELSGFTQCHFFAGIGGWSLAFRLAGLPDDFPAWSASMPCQPFSIAGKERGRHDDRHLAPHFLDLVRARRPGLLFGEQVASPSVLGKSSGKTRGRTAEAPAWAWLDELSDGLEASRYAVGAVDFPAASLGAKHIRPRTYWAAIANTKRDEQPRQEPRSRPDGRMGRVKQPVSWDEPWQDALARFRALDDGLPRSVVGTDAARNAIVPPQAAIFIESMMEVMA